MGKKSKKKGAANKAARKEKLQERREQQLEQLDQNFFSGSGDNTEVVDNRGDREYLVGDRVWFKGGRYDVDNPNTYRGIVQKVDGEFVDVKPLQALIDGAHYTERIPTKTKPPAMKYLFPDFCDMTLRFDVGDKVVCDADYMLPATVGSSWPIEKIEEQGLPLPGTAECTVPHYRCDKLFVDDYPCVAAPQDDNDTIRRRPTSFRFKVGDNVTFNSIKAWATDAAAAKQLQRSAAAWTEGKIILVDVCEEGLDYAAYGCSFKVAAKTYCCFIDDDDDEHIALVATEPRRRLFEAIEQDCSRNHFIYLTSHFNIDVSTFRDLVITKAIEFASYNAMLWLHRDCKIDVSLIRDEDGNNFLHMIANTSFASRFIRRMVECEGNSDFRLIEFYNPVFQDLNDNGEIWLQSLVRRGDIRALDVAFSPRYGLARKQYYEFSTDKLKLVASSVEESNNPMMQYIFDAFVSFRTIYEQFTTLVRLFYNTTGTEEVFLQDERLAVFIGRDKKLRAKLMTRFYRDWKDCRCIDMEICTIANCLVERGMLQLFQLLYEADQSMFENDYRVQSNEDHQQFIQEELRSSPRNEVETGCISINIYEKCILGGLFLFLDYEGFENYISDVINHFLNCDANRCPSLHHHLSRRRETNRISNDDDHVSYRLRLLQDDDGVEGRQNILAYLLSQHKDAPIDILFPLKHRQCWALRFMADKKYLNLEGLATKEKSLAQNASELTFLNAGQIPSNMTIRCCLTFAAVQYDDLQSLEWLCESFGAPTDLVGGWNLLHYSAYMGRIEIIGWLSTQPVWNALVSQASTRKPFSGAFAVHIAASCGHLYACDLLIGLKVPLEDENGKLPENYAEKSQHDVARKWAADRAKPQALLKDLLQLFNLVGVVGVVGERKSVREIKDFIISSKCLDIDTWRACDCYRFDDKVMGVSFRDVIYICCKDSDIELTKWICSRLYFDSSNRYTSMMFWGHEWGELDDRKKKLSHDDLVSFAEERGYDDIVGHLQGKWFKDISCADPLTHNSVSIFKSVFGGDDRLADIRAAILRVEVLANIADTSYSTMVDILTRGGQVDELIVLSRINSTSSEAVMAEAEESNLTLRHYNVGTFVMPTYITEWHYTELHPLSKLLLYAEERHGGQRGAHIILATESHTELLRYCLSNIKGWNAAMELNVIRIASFFGHASIVEMLLSRDIAFSLHSDEKDRQRAAIVGAGEALRYRDLEPFENIPKDFIIDKGLDIERKFEGNGIKDSRMTKYECVRQMMSESLIVAVLNGYMREFFDSDMDNKASLKTLKLLIDNEVYTHDEVIYAMKLLLDEESNIEWKVGFKDLLVGIIDGLRIHPFFYPKQMQEICIELVEWMRWRDINEAVISGFISFFEKLANAGVDIQSIGGDSRYRKGDFENAVISLQQKQLSDWSRFDTVKKGGSLADVQQVIENGGLTADFRDRGGLSLTHLSAAYDRVDLLEWLVVSRGMDLNAFDAQHRTTLDVAKASKALLATKWIVEWKAKTIIGSFLRRNYYHAMHRRKLQQSIDAATLIQSVIRAYATRKIFANVLVRRLEESQHFASVWGCVTASLTNSSASTSWTDIREHLLDIKVGLDDEMLDDTDQRLNRAMEDAVQEDSKEGDDGIAPDETVDLEELVPDDDVVAEDEVFKNEMYNNSSSSTQWLSFQMSSHVVKFLQQGDKKYRSFFVRRMRQLASGERSRILQKPLKGSKTLIYETYLEQKSGHRILWTEERGRLVIWYIAKHKQVSRLMQLIDDSKSRSARQQLPDSLVNELQNEGLLSQNKPKEVLLDIFGNVPLKIYDVNFNTISEITKESWTPHLHLTDEERDIVEAEGTVLVLGRSGTGKTVTITQRLEFDRQSRAAQDPSFTQLFVARSLRLCRYVEGAVGEDNRASFVTYVRLLSDTESTLPGKTTRNFNPSQRIDFGRFKRDFHNNSSFNERVSALISWTVIRTFLKGSIEAFQSPDGILPRDAFAEVERLGKNRCRVPVELRDHIYDEFLQYQKYLQDQQLWDDCDRVRHLLLRMKTAKEDDPDAFDEVQRSKVYVDEVQDYTQLEILLFFYLSGPSGLFLAGDPAQSVVEGTEFRFEEVRGVGHFVGSVMQKPKTVNVNFRSHSGILNCAGGVLDLMFTHFPSSAKQLKKDEGLFQGSRPGVLLGASVDQLNILLGDKLKGAVVLTHDESARHWRRLLNDYKLVYGVREAKGLEFKTVIILDFFREMPSSLQKPWRELVLGRATEDFERSHPLVATFLKLLYTGATRCIEKLFFVETKSSTAGDATMRWLTKKVSDRASYATRNNINDVEAMSMTSDEFISEGINNAELAQVMDLGQAQLLLERSIWCFEQTDVIELAAKARIHYSSILFRQELEPPHDEKNANESAVIEMRAAQLIESLMKEGLLFEVLNIFSSVLPFLSEYAKEELEKRFIRKVRLAVREE